MGELPDVAAFKEYLDATALCQEIDTVEVHSRQVPGDVSAEELKAALKHHSFESTQRRRKWLFVALDDNSWLVLHFGMTGNVKCFRDIGEEPDCQTCATED